jgi:hypothetical protein
MRVTWKSKRKIPGGSADNVVRAVTKNSRTLKFSDARINKKWDKPEDLARVDSAGFEEGLLFAS